MNEYALIHNSGIWAIGETVNITVMKTGKSYNRKVKDEKLGGLYVVINNTKYYLTDVEE